MTEEKLPLFVLLVDDEKEVLDQLAETLPEELEGYKLVWDPCPTFEEALRRLESRRYDLVVTDLAFRNRPGDKPEFRGLKTISDIRGKRFCPVVAYSSQSKPDDLIEDIFVRFADKAKGNDDIVTKLNEVLRSGIPGIARRLHDELDGVGSHYLWDFLSKRWSDLEKTGVLQTNILERLIRRRGATQLARLESGIEVAKVAPAEFYLYPKISGGEYRLGEIVKNKTTDEYRIILTPHCYLTIQSGQQVPRADFVLTVKTIKASEMLAGKSIDKGKDAAERAKRVRNVLRYPSEFAQPRGRHSFLPSFLEMPDSYCDFMQVESLDIKTLNEEYEPFAVLDTPFAEALQSRFVQFYSSIGTPDLRPEDFLHLIPEKEGPPAPAKKVEE